MNSSLEYFLHWEKTIPQSVFLRQPQRDEWKTWTWLQAGDEIRRVAEYIRQLNLPPHSNIALLSKNCAHWIMADLAIMMAGHVSVPLYPTLSAESLHQILEHSESKAIIIGKLDAFHLQIPGVPASVRKIGISAYHIDASETWENIQTRNQPIDTPVIPKPDDLMTIMYTSGTTGKPKGVMHVFKSFDATIKTIYEIVGIPKHPRVFSYLPLSHIAERIGIETAGLYLGAQFSFSESLEAFPKNLAATEPSYFIAVPRIWAKFQEKILEKMPQSKLDRLLSIPLVSMVIRRTIRKKLGLNQSVLFLSGAAPLSPSLMKWWGTLGVTIYQVYGMTEDCIYAHFNRKGANKIGTVGIPLPGLQVKIGPDEEIRVKSDYMMRGYFKEPELTAAMFDEEGFLKTGDTGEIDSEGFLKIVGRVKDQFKTDKGKYISPSPIEMKLLENTDIEQVCVVGMGIPQPIALVVLSLSGKGKSRNEIAESLGSTIDKINPSLEPYEKLETAVIMKNDWTQENGLMTPTLKVKRNELEKIYVPNYPKWYHEHGRVVWE
jgi:long-chain acyl-CoA synthetase